MSEDIIELSPEGEPSKTRLQLLREGVKHAGGLAQLAAWDLAVVAEYRQRGDPFTIVDPPVGPDSSPAELREWIGLLESLPDGPEVRAVIEESREWLDAATNASNSYLEQRQTEMESESGGDDPEGL